MAGTYKPVEVGVCEQGPVTDQGTWCFRQVTVPALTPPEEVEKVALARYFEKYGDTFVYKFWVQYIGNPIEIKDEDILMSESEYIQ